MHTSRPVYLNLLKIRLPIPGFVSILHRVSGVFMVLAIPFLIYVLDLSLRGPEGFAEAGAFFDNILVQLGLLVIIWSLMHHLLAGIRYLLIDIDVGVEKQAARNSAWVVLFAALVLALVVLGGVL